MQVEVIDLQFQGRTGAIASFLLEGPDGMFLIETGPESTLDRLVAALAMRGLVPEDLAAVLVTHVHLDHAGAAGWFAAQGVPLYAHSKAVRHLIDPTRLMESAREVYGHRFDALWGGMTPAPAEQVFAMGDGETVSIAGLEVRAVFTPGHAFHHHAYAVGEAIFTGDAAGARLDRSGYLSVTSAPPQFHRDCTLESLRKLEAARPEKLYLTHFGEVSEVERHFAAYREAVERNTAFVRQRLEEGMDAASLQVAYEAFNLEQAFRCSTPPEIWESFQVINGTAMCADGMRLFYESP